MSIKINEKILCIPPYLSTSWSRIVGLHVKNSVLSITMVDGETIQIPNLDGEMIQSIFHHHALFLEKESQPSTQMTESVILQGMGHEPSTRIAIGSSMEGLGIMMRHNPNQADAPDLPPEVLQKISAISKIIAPSEEQPVLPTAEPNCNCFHCQIARAINPTAAAQIKDEPLITEEELQFQQWTITQIGEQLFSVVNRLDEHEKYNVFLGEPVGCTCGKQGCDHLLAVLKS